MHAYYLQTTPLQSLKWEQAFSMAPMIFKSDHQFQCDSLAVNSRVCVFACTQISVSDWCVCWQTVMQAYMHTSVQDEWLQCSSALEFIRRFTKAVFLLPKSLHKHFCLGNFPNVNMPCEYPWVLCTVWHASGAFQHSSYRQSIMGRDMKNRKYHENAESIPVLWRRLFLF